MKYENRKRRSAFRTGAPDGEASLLIRYSYGRAQWARTSRKAFAAYFFGIQHFVSRGRAAGKRRLK